MVTLARFTPSLLDHETLERLFVNREPLLADAMSRISRASTTPERTHTLWVGPRGSGKTHLVSLAYHRARAMPGFGSTFQVSWLPEDPWTVDSLDAWYDEVLDHLEPAVPADQRGGTAEDALVRAARRHGPIVVFVENLDWVFDGIGPDGQRRLRGLLETHRTMLLVATATKLTEYMVGQAEPFYGFFTTSTLEPFAIDEAVAMLQAIAHLNGDEALAHRLEERSAHARLAAVEHLAGGQPRIWALLGSGLSIETFGELVSALLERFDDLTPFYQEQLARLSPHERKVVRVLADADRSMTVKELAAASGIGERSLAKTITGLRRNGWVRARTGLLADMVDQRLHYYELAEPLVRLAFQLKSARGTPVKLVLDFLAAWFDEADLTGSGQEPAVEPYLQAARAMATREPAVVLCRDMSDWGIGQPVEGDKTTRLYALPVLKDEPHVVQLAVLVDEGLVALEGGHPEPLLTLSSAVTRLVEHRLHEESPVGLRLQLQRLVLNRVVPDVGAWLARSEDVLNRAGDEHTLSALECTLRWTLRAGHLDAAAALAGRVGSLVRDESDRRGVSTALACVEHLIRAVEIDPARQLLLVIEELALGEDLIRWALAMHAVAFRTGHPTAVPPLWERVTQQMADTLGPDHPDTIAARDNLANAYTLAGRTAEATDLLEQVVADRIRILGPDHPDTLAARNNLAISYMPAGRSLEATDLLNQVVIDSARILGPDSPGTIGARNNLAVSYQSTGRAAEAVDLLEQVVADRIRILGPDHPDTIAARNNLANAYRSAGRSSEVPALLEQVVADSDRVLGTDHPYSIGARNNLANAYGSTGRIVEATVLLERVVAERDRILGSDHPDTVTARNNLAHAYRTEGRTAEAIALLEQVVPDCDRVLGPDHPYTLSTRNNLALSYESVGRTAEATDVLEQVVADSDRTLGPAHPDTIAARNNLALSYQSAGRVEETRHLLERVVADSHRVLGPDHPYTVTARNNLARCQPPAARPPATAAPQVATPPTAPPDRPSRTKRRRPGTPPGRNS